MEEIETIIKKFARSKSPGPDGWMVELFSEFFDLMGKDLVRVVEESRVNGFVSGALNSTFIALIPMNSKPESFDEYRPIALYNLVYKIISKLIANRIKPKLVECCSQEQFGFLNKRQIQDAIRVSQECIHTI